MKYEGLATLIACAAGVVFGATCVSPLILYVLICTVFNIC